MSKVQRGSSSGIAHRVEFRTSVSESAKEQKSVLSDDNIYRLGPEQIDKVTALSTEETNYLFGYVTPDQTVVYSTLTLGIFNEEDLVGAISITNYPNMKSIPPSDWEAWVMNLFNIHYLNNLNSFWVSNFLTDKRFTPLVLKPFLQYLFEQYDRLSYIVFLIPPVEKVPDIFNDCKLDHIMPKGGENFDPKKIFTLYIANRENYTCTYIIRKAVEEDNDDLVALIPKIFEEEYGSFYISELLVHHQNSGREIIVAEYNSLAVGVVILNKVVDCDLLNQEFQLVPFNGLRKPHEDDVINTKRDYDTSHNLNKDKYAVFPIPEELEEEEEEEKESSSGSSISYVTELDDDFSIETLSDSFLTNLAQARGPSSKASLFFVPHLLDIDFESRVDTLLKDSSPMGKMSRLQFEHYPLEELPIFYGESNTFAIEICCSKREHEDCIYSLLQACFDAFPEYDFAVMSLPQIEPVPKYVQDNFVRATPRTQSSFPHELYICSKFALSGDLKIRPIEYRDKNEIKEFLNSILGTAVDTVMKHIAQDFGNPMPRNFVYVVTCERKIVGVGIIGDEKERFYLETTYELRAWIATSLQTSGFFGYVEYLFLYPSFQCYQQHILRELHNLTYYDIFFYKIRPKNDPNFVMNLLPGLLPVHYKLAQTYDEELNENYTISPFVYSKSQHKDYSLYVSTRYLTSLPRYDVNHRIIVVGAGDTAIAFLENLIFTQTAVSHIYFNNLSLLCPPSAMHCKNDPPARDYFFINNGYVNKQLIDSLALKTFVNQINGVMTAIDRKEQYITANNETHLPYDLLILACGKQFQKVQPKDNRRADFPDNVFIINSKQDAVNALGLLKHLKFVYNRRATTMTFNSVFSTKSVQSNHHYYQAVVYGHYLEALCCITALLEDGIAPWDIVYMDPGLEFENIDKEPHKRITGFFNNDDVEDAVFDTMINFGITIYKNYSFYDWEFHSKNNTIISITFQDQTHRLQFGVGVFFCYHYKCISSRTFHSIVQSGLIFDGALVINKNFQTNDPKILAAGPLTKYSRRYYADHLSHAYFNREEIGSELGYRVKKQLIPPHLVHCNTKKEQHRKPIIEYCKLPGDLYYLSVSKPGKPVPLKLAMQRHDYGKVLVTGTCKNLANEGYFRLHINKYHTVETITCLSSFEPNYQNLIALYGHHETFLNNLLLRFKMGMIQDLFDFFREPWGCAIYHNSFTALIDSLDLIAAKLKTKDNELLLDKVIKKFHDVNWRKLTADEHAHIEEWFNQAGYLKILEDKLREFLQKYHLYLPMYATPLFVRMIVNEVRDNPLFSCVEKNI